MKTHLIFQTFLPQKIATQNIMIMIKTTQQKYNTKLKIIKKKIIPDLISCFS